MNITLVTIAVGLEQIYKYTYESFQHIRDPLFQVQFCQILRF